MASNIRFINMFGEGFQSIGKAEINFENLGTCYVRGINKYDNKTKSNGSGKSSLFSMLHWCLFGKTAAGIGNGVLNKFYKDNGCFVTVNLDIDSVNYEITRSIKHSKYETGVTVLKNNEDISGNNKTDSDKLIKDILGLDSELFTQMIFLSQGFANRFAVYAPKARKELLESLYGLDDKLNHLIESLKAKDTTVTEVLNMFNGEIIKYSTQQTGIVNQIEGLHSQIDRTNNDIAMLKASKCDITQVDLDALSDKVKQLQLQKEAVNNKISQRAIILNSLSIDRQTTMRDISQKKREIDGFSNNKVCPTCGTLLEDYSKNEHIQAHIKELTAEIKMLETSVEEIDKKIKSEEEIRNKLNFKLNNFNSDLIRVQNEFNNKSKLYEAEIKKDTEIAALNKNIEEYNAVILEKSEQLKEIEDLLKNLDSAINDKNRDSAVLKHSIRLANNQFKAYMLESIVKMLNLKLESLSKTLFENEIITINLNTKLDICLGSKVYEQLSGGEQRKVDVAIIIAQRYLAQQMNAVSANILILDEIFDGLDDVSFNLVLDLLSDEMQDVESTFIISHRDVKDIAFDHLITVVKEKDQISYISET